MSNSNSTKRKNFINGLEVSDEVAKNLLEKPLYLASASNNLKLYEEFIAHQKEPFKAIMYYFNDMLTELKEKGKISDFTEFRARIKAPKSALYNDELNNIKLINTEKNTESKVLDDIFAMEFIGATEKEVNFLLSTISKKAITTRKKDHDKPNGYKAKHRVFSINEETRKEIAKKFNIDDSTFFPVIECQFKTIAVAIEANTGTAAHINYKNIDPKAIQRKYNKGEFKLDYDIPQMWVSKDAEMVKLSPDETLKKLYPFLDISKKKDFTK